MQKFKLHPIGRIKGIACFQDSFYGFRGQDVKDKLLNFDTPSLNSDLPINSLLIATKSFSGAFVPFPREYCLKI